MIASQGQPIPEFAIRRCAMPVLQALARLGRGGGAVLLGAPPPGQTAEDALLEQALTHEATVAALAAALELRDDVTGGHAYRVTELAMELAGAVDPDLAADPALRHGFLLHDIGKIGIPDSILLKRGPLTEEEAEQMRYHTMLGEQLLAGLLHLHGVATDVILHHHERWDGTGYPDGLCGNEIPLAARIFSVADAFDTMTMRRPYKEKRSQYGALGEVIRHSGTQFDPQVVESFIPIVRRHNPLRP
jgi:HD-GYP domain-containing protein (c-di-GMP phosphodiesterase class II)